MNSLHYIIAIRQPILSSSSPNVVKEEQEKSEIIKQCVQELDRQRKLN